MNETQKWYCRIKFKGIDLEGKTKDFTFGDEVAGVMSWPSFGSLRDLEWIVRTPLVKLSTKIVEKVVDKKIVNDKKDVGTKAFEKHACSKCDSSFKSKRGLKVHERSH